MGQFDRNEVIAALAIMAFGGLWLFIGLGYSWGSTVRIGAGVFPVALSIILIALCVAVVLLARGAAPVALGLRMRPVALILGGVLVWALSVDTIGFLPATAILVSMCTLAERSSTWRTALGLTVALCLFGYIVFLKALNIPISVIGG